MGEWLGWKAFTKNDFTYVTCVEKDLFGTFIAHPTQVIGVREALEIPMEGIVVLEVEDIIRSDRTKATGDEGDDANAEGFHFS